MHRYKLRPDQVIQIRNSRLNNKELAYLYDVSVSTIIDIRLGRTWPNVGAHELRYNGRNRKLDAKGIDYL